MPDKRYFTENGNWLRKINYRNPQEHHQIGRVLPPEYTYAVLVTTRGGTFR